MPIWSKCPVGSQWPFFYWGPSGLEIIKEQKLLPSRPDAYTHLQTQPSERTVAKVDFEQVDEVSRDPK